jgi:hypothetical protein
VDSYISSVVGDAPPLPRKPRVSKDALSILATIRESGCKIQATQVAYTCATRRMVAIVDGEGVDSFGHRVVMEWKTGYSYRHSRQRRMTLPHLEAVFDNARSRALLQLAVGMALSGARHGMLVFANGDGTTNVLWLPRAMPQFFKPGAADAILDALSLSQRR